MFWKKITKIVLYVNVGFGLIVSIAAGKAVGKMLDYMFDSGSGTGFLIFLLGIVLTIVNSCMLGTICEIADNVEKSMGTPVPANVPTPRPTASAPAPRPSASPAPRPAASAPAPGPSASAPASTPATAYESVDRLVVATPAASDNAASASKPASEGAETPAARRPKKVYDNRVSAQSHENDRDDMPDLDKEINVNDKDSVDLDATVALPETAFEKMGLVVDKEEAEGAQAVGLQRKEPVAFCVKCGAKNHIDSAFCYSCGNKLAK